MALKSFKIAVFLHHPVYITIHMQVFSHFFIIFYSKSNCLEIQKIELFSSKSDFSSIGEPPPLLKGANNRGPFSEKKIFLKIFVKNIFLGVILCEKSIPRIPEP
jgi:hypothetical protein